MRFHGAAVAAGWAAGLGALAAVLAGFGGGPAVLAIFGSAAGLVALFAAAAWRGRRARRGRQARPAWRAPGSPVWWAPANGDSVVLAAIAVLIAGLAWVFWWQLAPIAVIPLFFAVRREISIRRGGT
jgi:hypothetical protein